MKFSKRFDSGDRIDVFINQNDATRIVSFDMHIMNSEGGQYRILGEPDPVRKVAQDTYAAFLKAQKFRASAAIDEWKYGYALQEKFTPNQIPPAEVKQYIKETMADLGYMREKMRVKSHAHGHAQTARH